MVLPCHQVGLFEEGRGSEGSRICCPEPLPLLTVTATQYNPCKCLKTKTAVWVFFSNRTGEDLRRGSVRTRDVQPDAWSQLLYLPVGKFGESHSHSCKPSFLICKMGVVTLPTSQESCRERGHPSQVLCTCWLSLLLSHRKGPYRHLLSSDRIHLLGL